MFRLFRRRKPKDPETDMTAQPINSSLGSLRAELERIAGEVDALKQGAPVIQIAAADIPAEIGEMQIAPGALEGIESRITEIRNEINGRLDALAEFADRFVFDDENDAVMLKARTGAVRWRLVDVDGVPDVEVDGVKGA